MYKKILFSLALSYSFVSANTLDEIKASKIVKIGVRKNLPPFSEFKDGSFSGFEIELANKIAKDIFGDDVKIELIGLDAKERVSALEDNRVDLVIANFSKTKAREEKVDFSIPYLSSFLAVLTKKDSKIKDANDLSSKKIIYVEGTTASEFLEKKSLSDKQIPCKSMPDCVDKLLNNQADAFIQTNILIAKYPLENNNLEISINSISNPNYICVGAKKGNKELLKSVNDEILNLSKTNFFENAYKDTFEKFFQGSVDKRYLLLDDLYKTMF